LVVVVKNLVKAWSLVSALLVVCAVLVLFFAPDARAFAPAGEAVLAFWLGVALFRLTRFFRAQ
jgi:hypothetical protein